MKGSGRERMCAAIIGSGGARAPVRQKSAPGSTGPGSGPTSSKIEYELQRFK